MTKIPIDEVLAVLRYAPNGLTTGEVAAKLNTDKLSTISGRLSRLATYGRIQREFVRPAAHGQGIPPRICRWRSNDVVVVDA